jgi:2'-5' RNA ligase
MRLFTGIDLPDSIKERLDFLISRLRTTAHLKWSPAYNLHITTKFIGEWPSERLPELVAKLSGVQVKERIEIDVRGLGWFPNPHHPRVFWAGVQASPALPELARATEQACSELGIPAEDRPFSPHLTLARIKQPTPLQALRSAVAEIESAGFGSFTAKSYDLYLSQPGPSGSIYTPLNQFALPLA